MRIYDYSNIWQQLLTPDIVLQLTRIHEYKGEQNLFVTAKADSLNSLLELAKIQSTEASNKIEGIYTSDERLRMLVKGKTNPRNRNEQEIMGYRDVLATIHDNYDYIPPKPGMILQLHRDLYKFSGMDIGGKYKTANNIIAEEDENGTQFIRFQPVEAWATAESIENMCQAYDKALENKKLDPLLLIPVFILDFLCIHPFDDGNGRMSRLLTLLLLYRQGYIVGKYISIEKLIEESKETYYEVLQQSSYNWHTGDNDYKPFVRYMLGVILKAYGDFCDRVEYLTLKDLSKPQKIEAYFKEKLNKVTTRELKSHFPDISTITIQRTISELLRSGAITKIGGGRYTSYIWNGER